MKQLICDIKSIGLSRAISCAVVGKYYGCKGRVAETKAKVKSVITQWNMDDEEENRTI